ncbi:hypothetical protein HPB47_016079 [Ixodes persulcatus]|uniref:Uncharacterized protein n=1 Tax=Ixodes persulcatus TaxID=34615 RepID=A0AC60QRS1_IXOPE|nr:hypothetical protein HPB47_016079 [Ixodes persulcatus]
MKVSLESFLLEERSGKSAFSFSKGKNLFPYSLIGFCPFLLTQDAMKLLKHRIFNKNTRNVRTTLGLHLQKAFDNITHAHILDFISELGLGDTFQEFVSSFLRSRKATLEIGDLKRGGLREDNLLRLFHAFLMSHITYEPA